MENFKIRCHAIGKIMAGEIGLTEIQNSKLSELESRANGVGKPLTPNMESELAKLINKRDNPELPEGAKSYCKEWLIKHKFKRNKEFKNAVIEKGLACEQDAIELLSLVHGEDYVKNEDYFSNDFCHGSPDILTLDSVRDIKSSWDLYTFPMFEDEIPKKEYWWQLQGYMWLTGNKKAYLDYVLIDTPMPLILLDLKKLYYQSGGVAEEWTQEKYEFLYPNYQFKDIPNEQRIKTFEFTFEDWIPEQITYRVELCRKYINSLQNHELC